MRLSSFRARGFRSLADVHLTNLPDIILLSGQNDVGKSNLIRAVGTFLEALRYLMTERQELTEEAMLSVHLDDAVRITGWNRPAQIFRYGESVAILGGTLQIDNDGWDIEISIVEGPSGEILFRVLRSRIDGETWTEVARGESARIVRLERALATPWQLVSAQRSFQTEVFPLGVQGDVPLEPTGANLKTQLFKAANGDDRARRRVFAERFVPAMTKGPFSLPVPIPILAKGERFELWLEEEHAVEDRGSGVQQWVLMAGLITLSQAAIIGIEEPELHLSWNNQIEVATALRALISSTHVPNQMIVSTHSPLAQHLRDGDVWFDVTYDGIQTVVARHQDIKSLEARSATVDVNSPLLEMRLLPERVVRLSKEVVDHLSLQPGDQLFCKQESAPRMARLYGPDTVADSLTTPGTTHDG